jgi:xanthine phosphoribosyltransferase
MNNTQLIITWEQFYSDTQELGGKLMTLGPWDGIIGVARGGLVPATIIAHILGIRSIDTVCISSYSDETKAKDMDLEILTTIEKKHGKWLVVDDLVDTGHTAKVVKDLVPSAFISCVYAKPQGEPFIDIFAKSIPQSTWIVFPWEV